MEGKLMRSHLQEQKKPHSAKSPPRWTSKESVSQAYARAFDLLGIDPYKAGGNLVIGRQSPSVKLSRRGQ
jgi:hypothetical protein